jgi:hypothetical protein
MWEEDGRPEGQSHVYWQRAEHEIGADAPAGNMTVPGDEAAAGVSLSPAADPLRNPEPFPPAEDPMYPAVTGPEEVPAIEGARESLNPEEIVEPRRSARPPRAAERSVASGTRRTGGAEVKLRRRPGNTSPSA